MVAAGDSNRKKGRCRFLTDHNKRSTVTGTRVGSDATVRVPAAVRRALDIDPGDRLRWRLTDGGELMVETAAGSVGEPEPVETSEPTHAAADRDEVAGADR